MYNRAVSHFNTHESKGKKMLHDLHNVDYVLTGSELIALLLESEEIKKYKPRYNRMRKGSDFTHSIEYFTDKQGIINFRVAPFEEAEQPLVSFTSYTTARERLEYWLDEHKLCLRYCGLVSEDAVCFNHHIKKCNGICCGEEEIEEYNRRANEVLARHRYEKDNFIIVDRGKERGEKSLVYVKDGKYYGYGYINNECNISSMDDLEDAIKKQVYYPDSDMLVKSYLQAKPRKIISFQKTQ
jgi:DNA polymerase-3 subunit epsilon